MLSGEPNESISVGVVVDGSLNTDSAQKPERIGIREDFERCPGSKWLIKQPNGICSYSSRLSRLSRAMAASFGFLP
ncbi:hypothetical protein CK910_03575 [Aeromonas sp. CA23]|nr:hypothetical protein CK910_03575 [Aeromonas sp. CA23]